MRGRIGTVLVIGAVGILLSAGCARHEHLREDHGEAKQAWFGAQQRKVAEGPPAHGLDSEEAAAIHRRYQRMLRGEARAHSDAGLLRLEESTHARGP